MIYRCEMCAMGPASPNVYCNLAAAHFLATYVPTKSNPLVFSIRYSFLR